MIDSLGGQMTEEEKCTIESLKIEIALWERRIKQGKEHIEMCEKIIKTILKDKSCES